MVRAERGALTRMRLDLLAQLARGPLVYVNGALGIAFDPLTGKLHVCPGFR